MSDSYFQGIQFKTLCEYGETIAELRDALHAKGLHDAAHRVAEVLAHMESISNIQGEMQDVWFAMDTGSEQRLALALPKWRALPGRPSAEAVDIGRRLYEAELEIAALRSAVGALK